ncbi:MAG: ComEC/Rec2 family competence protein [Candidatus Pristimantibacillus sp.]
MKLFKILLTSIILSVMLTSCSVSQENFIKSAQAVADGIETINISSSDQKLQFKKGQLNVLFIDIGQGTSVLIEKNGKYLLYDTGDNDKEELMVRTLKEHNIKKIDVVIGSHPHADHIGGLDAVIDNFDVKKLYMPKVTTNTKTFESVLLSAKKKGLKITSAKAGTTIDFGKDISVDVVAPIKSKYDDLNDYSVVVKLTYKNQSVLLTGDASYESEMDMVKSGEDLRAALLLTPHHGSSSSSSQKMISAVNPEYTVIQVGANNKYGHPTDKVLKRLEKQKVKVFRNDLQGSILATTNGDKWEFKTER